MTILTKTKGSGIMVSDFVEERGGFLKLLPDKLDRTKLQYPTFIQLFDSSLSMAQREKAIGLASAL